MKQETIEKVKNWLDAQTDPEAGKILDEILEDEVREAFKYERIEEYKKDNIVDFICEARYSSSVKEFLNKNFDKITQIYDIVLHIIKEGEEQ